MKPLEEMAPTTSKKAPERVLGVFAYYSKQNAEFSGESYDLYKATECPLKDKVLAAFEKQKISLKEASLNHTDETIPFQVECDASDVAVSATLNQNGRLVAFMSRMLSCSEIFYPAIEKEATAVIEAVRKWRHLLAARHFTIITD